MSCGSCAIGVQTWWGQCSTWTLERGYEEIRVWVLALTLTMSTVSKPMYYSAKIVTSAASTRWIQHLSSLNKSSQVFVLYISLMVMANLVYWFSWSGAHGSDTIVRFKLSWRHREPVCHVILKSTVLLIACIKSAGNVLFTRAAPKIARIDK